MPAGALAGDTLALHPRNPRYFVYRGQPTVLVGSGEHYGAVLNPDFDYRTYLATLAADGDETAVVAAKVGYKELAERALLVVSGFVVVVGLAGMLTALLTSLEERRREMAILRSLGARPVHVFSLVVGEAGLLALAGALVGVAALYALLFAARPVIESRLGLFIAVGAPSAHEFVLFAVVCLAGVLVGVVPGWQHTRPGPTTCCAIMTLSKCPLRPFSP